MMAAGLKPAGNPEAGSKRRPPTKEDPMQNPSLTYEQWKATQKVDRRVAQIPTEHHRRETDCVRASDAPCCAKCGRPMTDLEALVYHAL
jgi:hypothetical protein